MQTNGINRYIGKQMLHHKCHKLYTMIILVKFTSTEHIQKSTCQWHCCQYFIVQTSCKVINPSVMLARKSSKRYPEHLAGRNETSLIQYRDTRGKSTHIRLYITSMECPSLINKIKGKILQCSFAHPGWQSSQLM